MVLGIELLALVKRVCDDVRNADGGSGEATRMPLAGEAGEEAEHALYGRLKRRAVVEAVAPVSLDRVPIPGRERHRVVRRRDVTPQTVSIVALAVIDVISDDEHGVDNEARFVEARSEQDDRASGEVAQL